MPSRIHKRDEYRQAIPKNVAELRAEAKGLVARFTLVAETGKQDSTQTAWAAVKRLYQHADSLPLSVELSLKGEMDTWSNMLRLAQAIVVACEKVEQPNEPDECGT